MNKSVLVLAGLAATFAIMHSWALAGGGVLSLENVRDLARQAIEANDFDRVPTARVVRIAWIESHFDPSASRYEWRLGDASTGLMQTLLSTAQWLAKDMEYSSHGIPKMNELLAPQISLYFGAAYLQYLSRYRGQGRSEEWVVRSYNGGPGNVGKSTDNYWLKYLSAKQEVG